MLTWMFAILSPLSGLEVGVLPERILAVAVDNSPSARPQSGLSFAQIIYEVPVEGGITRLLAFFLGDEPEIIGPVRSLRKYMIPLIQEYDALVAHCGGDPGSWYEVEIFSIPSLNELEGKGIYFRSSQRKAPYNLYLKVPETRNYAVKKGLQKGKYPFSSLIYFSTDAQLRSGEGFYLKIPYASGKVHNTVEWKYDEESQQYFRWVNGILQKDVLNGKPITTSHIILQKVWKKQVEGAPTWRIDLGVLGSGGGWVFSQGKRAEITWRKSSRTKKTEFRYLDGTALFLPPGKIWIQLIPDSIAISF